MRAVKLYVKLGKPVQANIHPSGFYAWVENPLSHRAREDARQTQLLKSAWKDSGKVYGYPLPGRVMRSMIPRGDDLMELGEISCPNRVARLTRLAGIRAEIGYNELLPNPWTGSGVI